MVKILNLNLAIMLEYQNTNNKKIAKGYTSNWSEEVFVIKKIANTVPWTFVINDLNGEEF